MEINTLKTADKEIVIIKSNDFIDHKCSVSFGSYGNSKI